MRCKIVHRPEAVLSATICIVQTLASKASNAVKSGVHRVLCHFDRWADVHAGQIGEHPVGIPNNLMPYVQQVSLFKHPNVMYWLSFWHEEELRSRAALWQSIARPSTLPTELTLLTLRYHKMFITFLHSEDGKYIAIDLI